MDLVDNTDDDDGNGTNNNDKTRRWELLKVLTEALLWIQVFLYMTPCSFVYSN
jgi:hypothetical protein